MDIVREILVNVLIFFITGIIIVISNAARKWLESLAEKNKQGENNLIISMLYDVITFTVKGIEQMYQAEVGPAEEWGSYEKKKIAKDQVLEWVKQNGYENLITESLVDSVIEAAVKEMNDAEELSDSDL